MGYISKAQGGTSQVFKSSVDSFCWTGEYQSLAKTKQAALDAMYSRHPERFTRGRPIAQMPPSEVCINPVPEDADQATVEKGVNFPTLKRAIEKIR